MSSAGTVVEERPGESGCFPDEQASLLPLAHIRPTASQPRRYFDRREMARLVDSVRRHGVLQPILVRPLTEGDYELVSGERRFRAAREAGLTVIPAVVRAMSAEMAAEFALIENLQRADLNPLEQTEGILRLIALRLDCSPRQVISLLYRMHNSSAEDAADDREQAVVLDTFRSLGTMTWESFLKNRLPLLNLPSDLAEPLREGRLAYTKAKALARIKDRTRRQHLLQQVLAEDLPLSRIRALAEEGLLPAEEAPQRLSSLYRQFKKQRPWEDPRKRERLLALLAELEQLASE
jgi:ParB family chromosome partitioning protein